MSDVICDVYQVHNYGPYRFRWWAWLRAKLCAMNLHMLYMDEDSGIYYRTARKPLYSNFMTYRMITGEENVTTDTEI